jgi:hypothetical protein
VPLGRVADLYEPLPTWAADGLVTADPSREEDRGHGEIVVVDRATIVGNSS